MVAQNAVSAVGLVRPIEMLKCPSGERIHPKEDFKSVLERCLSDSSLRFSKHAVRRLHSRNIELTENDVTALGEAVEKARSKGSRDSLLLLRGLAFLVNVENQTVLTAMNEDDMKEKVFTNIDSTVIVE